MKKIYEANTTIMALDSTIRCGNINSDNVMEKIYEVNMTIIVLERKI